MMLFPRLDSVNEVFKMLLLLFTFWIILNGAFSLQIVCFGLGLCALLFFFCRQFWGYSLRLEWRILRLLPSSLMYFFVLVREMFLAAFLVTKLVLFTSCRPNSVLVEFDSPLQTQAARFVLATSITLTPGTYTVGLSENHFCIHAIEESMAQDLCDSVFVRRLKAMEERYHD